MKIYNFAVEVYDSPGSGIGRWRSCGRQERELISHEVILQLLFSNAPSLNTSNTTFSWLFVCALVLLWLLYVRNSHTHTHPPSKKTKQQQQWAMEPPRAMLMWLFMLVKMRDHHTPGWWDYFREITWTKWGNLGRGLRGGEWSFGGVASAREMMDYQQR